MRTLKADNIFLIGPMGAGKSSIGKQLAQSLNKKFFDTDEEIEKRTGVDIGWIFDLEGEAGFRARETAVLTELTALNSIVLATGGGSILEATNRAMLAAHGTVIYLDVSLGYQYHRTLNESRRPMLRVANRGAVLEQLYYERRPLYAEIADWHLLTDNRNIRYIVDSILDWLNSA